MKSKEITLQVGQQDLTFNVSLEAYNQCINTLQPNNKVAPMHNFLVNVAKDEKTRKAVNQIYEDALTSEVFGALVNEFKPSVEITVKKSSPGPEALNRTD